MVDYLLANYAVVLYVFSISVTTYAQFPGIDNNPQKSYPPGPLAYYSGIFPRI